MVFTFINWVNSTSLWVHLLSFRFYMVPVVKWYTVKSLVENVKGFNTLLKSGKLPSLNTPVLTFHSNHPRWKPHKPQSIYSWEWNKVGWGCLGPIGISNTVYPFIPLVLLENNWHISPCQAYSVQYDGLIYISCEIIPIVDLVNLHHLIKIQQKRKNL